jgi:hypothetical protein
MQDLKTEFCNLEKLMLKNVKRMMLVLVSFSSLTQATYEEKEVYLAHSFLSSKSKWYSTG